MTRKQFEEVMEGIRSEIGDYTKGQNLIDDSEYLYNNDIDFTELDSKILGEGRWSVSKKAIYKIGDEFYIAVMWNDPSTEMQDGQPTDCYIEEVEPYEETVIKYRRV